MFIFNANAYARNPAGAAKNIDEMIKAIEGEILASRLFDERKLAYPINGHRKGVYWLTYANLESTSIVKLNRALSSQVLRVHLFAGRHRPGRFLPARDRTVPSA